LAGRVENRQHALQQRPVLSETGRLQ